MHIILKRSTLGENTKKHSCFQECVRRLVNVSPDLPWSESVSHLNRYSWSLHQSGYSASERYNLISGAIMRVRKMRKEVVDGFRKSLYRSGREIASTKVQKID